MEDAGITETNAVVTDSKFNLRLLDIDDGGRLETLAVLPQIWHLTAYKNLGLIYKLSWCQLLRN